MTRRALIRFVSRLTLALPLLDACLLISIHAQVPADPLGINPRRLTADMVRDYNTAPNTAVVIFKVFGERKGHLLDRQAVLKLTNPATQCSTWQTTSRDPAGENLETGSEAVFLDVALGVYDAEITAVGFLSAHQEVRISTSMAQERFEVILQRDPLAANLDVTDAQVSTKTRKELKRAVSALKSHLLPEAEKHLNRAYQSSPNSSNINFLLGYLFFEKRDYAQAERYLSSASKNSLTTSVVSLRSRISLIRHSTKWAIQSTQKAANTTTLHPLPKPSPVSSP